jgi:hypothetical protein
LEREKGEGKRVKWLKTKGERSRFASEGEGMLWVFSKYFCAEECCSMLGRSRACSVLAIGFSHKLNAPPRYGLVTGILIPFRQI